MSDERTVLRENASESPVDMQTTDTTEDKSVSYDSHRKLLSEKKRLQEKLMEREARVAEYEQAQKEAEEKRLKDNEQWKEFATKKEQEAAEARKELEATRHQIADARKLDAFLTTIDGKIDRKFWDFIDTSSIITNPDTGEIDGMSVTKAVEAFKANYSELIQYPGQKTGLPNESPKSNNSTLTYEDWLKLPPKDMKARYNEMLVNDRAKH